MIDLVIFDLDGTLIDSLDDLTDATNHVRSHFRLSRLSREEVRHLVGQGARRLVERALPGFSREQVDEGVQQFLDYNHDHLADKTVLYPAVKEVLETLADRKLRLAVISNKNVALCREIITILGIDGFFVEIMGADSLPFRKPSPEPVLKLLADQGVAPHRAVIVGDSINDIAAGRGAGIATIGCTYGYGDLSELADADYRVSEFAQLAELPIFKA